MDDTFPRLLLTVIVSVIVFFIVLSNFIKPTNQDIPLQISGTICQADYTRLVALEIDMNTNLNIIECVKVE